MNKIIVIGHLGRDPEMRYLPSGQGVSNFSVATSRKYTTDKVSYSYNVLFNAFKRLSQRYSPTERAAMFHDTAARVYRIDV